MAANTTARLLSTLIGSDSQDWSASALRLEIGRDSIGQAGIISFRGTLLLQEDTTNPESIQPLDNPSRWFPGQEIAVQVADDSGTLIDFAASNLFILQEPTFDYASRILSIDVGDALAWYNSQEPSDDASAITVCDGADTDLATVATRYLEAAGIPSGNINLGTWGRVVNFPVPKPRGSYVGRAGEIAYAADFRQLYVDSSGIVRAKQLDTAPDTADIAITEGTNDIEFTPDPDPLQPFETVQVVGLGKSSSAQTNPIIKLTGDADTELYKFQEFDLTITQLLGPNGTTVTVDGGDYIKLLKRERLRTRKSLIIDGSAESTKIVEYDKTEIRYYKLQGDCQYRLYYVFRYNDAAEVTFLEDGSDLAVRKEEETENYTYSTEDECIRIVVDRWSREDALDPAGTISRRKVGKVIREWVKQGEDLYDYEETEKQSAVLIYPDKEFSSESNQWRLVNSKPAIVQAATEQGKNSPQRTEYWTQYINDTTPYEGSASWVHRGKATGRDRKRPPYQLPDGLAFDVGQCNDLAAKHRDLLVGRDRQHFIRFPISDELLAIDEPFPRIDYVQPGRTRQFLADALNYVFEAEQSYAECLGIQVFDSTFTLARAEVEFPSFGFSSTSIQSLFAFVEATFSSFGFSAETQVPVSVQLSTTFGTFTFEAESVIKDTAQLSTTFGAFSFTANAIVSSDAELATVFPSFSFDATAPAAATAEIAATFPSFGFSAIQGEPRITADDNTRVTADDQVRVIP